MHQYLRGQKSVGIQNRNQVLDEIIAARRSIRSFKQNAPPREMIETILQAGLAAPFAGLAVGSGKDYRRFVVIPRDSGVSARVAAIGKQQMALMLEHLQQKIQQEPSFAQQGQAFVKRMEMIAEHGLPIGNAPYYIVVAERKGFPPAEAQSLAHCLQNMWLKATAMGLGFQLISATEQMSDNEDFCKLLGIPFGEFRLDGCLIGYPDRPPAPIERPRLTDVMTWLS
jgi:nitroreductase